MLIAVSNEHYQKKYFTINKEISQKQLNLKLKSPYYLVQF